MTSDDLLARIERLFAERGGAEYHGEAVSQLEHGLQAATFAEQDGAPAALVAAALLHDVGHLLHTLGEHCAAQGIDDTHEELGVRFLEKGFGPAVTGPVRLHVAAKRFLCATRPDYFAKLSPASVTSLHLQGGPMSAAEAAAFRADPHAAAAVRVRGWDDRAKVAGLATPDFSHFRPHLEAALRADA
jgi:phosphonate degradation associated HDIG domain protein